MSGKVLKVLNFLEFFGEFKKLINLERLKESWNVLVLICFRSFQRNLERTKRF